MIKFRTKIVTDATGYQWVDLQQWDEQEQFWRTIAWKELSYA